MDGTTMDEVEPNRGWPGVGRVAGYVSARALLVATILYLLDATNALGANNSLIGPPLAFWLGRHLGAARAERAAGPAPAVV